MFTVLVSWLQATTIVSSILFSAVAELQPLVAVNVKQGLVVGKVLPEGEAFYGIPFSQPPVGEHRWRKPRDPLSYEDKYWNATYKRPGCDQVCDLPFMEYTCPHATSEDCLYLNVWIPSKLLVKSIAETPIGSLHYEVDPTYLGSCSSLPVMVWLYGGNFRNGAGSSTLYDGRFMADRGEVIVVTTNFRVAHLGFLVQGELPEEGKGNFGFWDQVKALEWIKSNIHKFGGNPKQVTLFGQSSGAESIGVHLTSSVSKHLFQRAIMQSYPFGLPFRNLTDARKFGDGFARAAGCKPNDMTCLRAKTVLELEKAFNDTSLAVTDPNHLTLIFQPWSPVIDWDVVPAQPIKLFMLGKVQKKPMLLGATVNEGMIYLAKAYPGLMNDGLYYFFLATIFKQDYSEVASQYPAQCENASYGCDNEVQLDKLATEYIFKCPQRIALKSTNSPRWWYIFNETWSFYEAWDEPKCFHRVCHAAELPFLFGIENLTNFYFSNEERALSSRVLNFWTNFAKYGNPNFPSKAVVSSARRVSKATIDATFEWPQFENHNDYQAIQFTSEGDFLMKKPYYDTFNFWDDVDAYTHH